MSYRTPEPTEDHNTTKELASALDRVPPAAGGENRESSQAALQASIDRAGDARDEKRLRDSVMPHFVGMWVGWCLAATPLGFAAAFLYGVWAPLGVFVGAVIGLFPIALLVWAPLCSKLEAQWLASLPFPVSGYLELLRSNPRREGRVATGRIVTVVVTLGGTASLDEPILERIRARAGSCEWRPSSRRLQIVSGELACPFLWEQEGYEHYSNRGPRTWLRHVLGSLVGSIHPHVPVTNVEVT